MGIRSGTGATLAVVVIFALAGCSARSTTPDVADTNATDVPDATDASDIVRDDVASACVNGGSCNAGASCNMPTTCTQCGHDLFTPYAPTCMCASGRWQCGVIDCFMPGPNVYTDPACSVPSVQDAGVDVQATDGCGAVDVMSVMAEAGACPVGTTRCGSVCVDLRVDPQNCGACGNTCLAGQLCSNFACGCECAAGRAVCNVGCNPCTCVDLSTDPMHCGSCAIQCNAGEYCAAGGCVADDAGRD